MPQLVVDAILFDLDGTLVDSTASVERNWRRLAERMGRPFAELRPLIHGIPGGQVLRQLEPEMADDEVAELVEFLLDGEATDTGDVMALPGTLAALDVLPTNRWAIVTSGATRLARARIKAGGLPIPRTMVTADDVAVGKPDPAPYLLGAQRLGFAPARCLVFEDAPAGVTSAKAAGIPVIGLRTTHRDLDAPMIDSLAEVEFSADRRGVIVTYP